MLMLVLQGRLLGNFFKLFDKIRLILESALITDLGYIKFTLYKYFTSMSYPDFVKELSKCLTRFCFKINIISFRYLALPIL